MDTRTQQLIQSEIAKAVEGLLGNLYANTVTRAKAEHVLGTMAHQVATAAAHGALLGLMNADDMAARLGISARRVRALAKGRNIGWQVGQGVWVFRPEDVDLLQVRVPGRPKKAPDAQ